MISSEIQDNQSQKRIEDKLEAHKEEAKKKISTTKPIEDFKEMINYKYEDLTVKAISQMEDIIIKFIIESFKGSYYVRAIQCLKVLRDVCIEEDEVTLFNSFLEKLKSDYPKEKFSDLWRLVIDNRIAPISKNENPKSTLDQTECNAWLDKMDKKEVITSTLKDMDDLIADID